MSRIALLLAAAVVVAVAVGCLQVAPQPIPPPTTFSSWSPLGGFTMSSGAIPMPVSCTAIVTAPSAPLVISARTLPPDGVNFTALLKRLTRTCLIRCPSKRTCCGASGRKRSSTTPFC